MVLNQLLARPNLHLMRPIITIAMLLLKARSWADYLYFFLTEAQGDNMAFYTQIIHLAQGPMVMKTWQIATMFKLSTMWNSPFCQLVPLLGRNMHSFFAWSDLLNMGLLLYRTKGHHSASSGYENITAAQVTPGQ